MKNFIDINEMNKFDNTVIIDVSVGNEELSGRQIYEKGHIENAYYMDVDEDLSDKPTEYSGQHPLPNKEEFKKKLDAFGATNSSTFIIYDAGDNFSSGRLWFLLKYFGLKQAYIINGGRNTILNNRIELTDVKPDYKSGNVTLVENDDLLVPLVEVIEQSENPKEGKVLVDSRSYERYLGLIEPLYEKAGHIPNAKSYFFGDNYEEDGKLKSIEFLKGRFKDLAGKEIILSCGSGVTACSNFVVMDEIGMKPKLYEGSYSQWLKLGRKIMTGVE